MKEQVFQKIQVLIDKAKDAGKQDESSVKSTYTVNSLADNIKTKEQADAFKKLLRSL